MTLRTQPIFYYGMQVTQDCRFIDFKEGEFGAELSAQLPVGTYSFEEVRALLEDAMNLVGLLNYTVIFDRFTRKYTIHSNNYFELLVGTGSNKTNYFQPLR